MKGIFFLVAHLAGASSGAPVKSSLAGGTQCFPAPNDGNCLSWRVEGENITLSATFLPDAGGGGVPVWGAWGLPALTCGNMWPAHVWLVLPSPTGGVRVEDRMNVGHAAPQCAGSKVPQLSRTLSGSVAADGSVNVTWTRPLNPAPVFQQPPIVKGSTPLISAYNIGPAALAFPICSTAGLPFHTNVMNGVSVDFFAGVPEAPPPVVVTASAKNYSGLSGVAAVCGDACTALTHLDAFTGRVTFPSSASPPLFPMLTALDSAARVIHVLAFDNTPQEQQGSSTLFVASLSADTGALQGSCPTDFPRNDDFDLASVNFAFDSTRGEVLIASCTDSACVAPLNVTALHPGSCATRVVATLAVEELGVGGSGAVDPHARVLVLSLARGGTKPGLAVVAINIEKGTTIRVTPETQDTPYVQSLVFDEVSRLIYGLAFSTAGYSQPVLVAINAATGKLSNIAPIAGCEGALPDSLAVSPDGERLFFIGAGDGGAATLFTAFTANASLASSVPLQGAITLGDAPTALLWLP